MMLNSSAKGTETKKRLHLERSLCIAHKRTWNHSSK